MIEQKGTLRVLALGIAAALLISGCMSVAQAAAPPAEPEAPEIIATAVEVANLAPTVIRNELTYIGQVRPNRTVNVVGMLAAEVTAVNFDIGDTVQEGDILFTLDAKDMQDQLRTLRSSLAAQDVGIQSAQYSLQMAIDGSADQRLRELEFESGIRQAGYAADIGAERRSQAQDAWEKIDDMLDDAENAVSDLRKSIVETEAALAAKPGDPTLTATLDTLKENLATAQSAVTELEALEMETDGARDIAGIGRRQADATLRDAQETYNAYKEVVEVGKQQATKAAEFGVLAAMAGRTSTETQLSILQSNLERAIVTSPISGVVSARNVEVGQMASQASMPFTIIQMDPVLVEVSVSETLINKIHVGDRVAVSLQALEGGGSLTGTVTAVSPVANAGSTFPIRVELPNADHLIKPGMFSQVTFIEAQKDGVLVVDKNVVLRDETSEYVFVIKDGVAVKMPVTTGLTTGTQVELVSGVGPDDDVVVVGQEYLYADTPVNIVSRNGQRIG